MSILVTTSSFASYSSEPLKLLDEEGYKIELNQTGRKITSDELLSYAKGCEGLIAGTEQYSKDVLSKMENLMGKVQHSTRAVLYTEATGASASPMARAR